WRQMGRRLLGGVCRSTGSVVSRGPLSLLIADRDLRVARDVDRLRPASTAETHTARPTFDRDLLRCLADHVVIDEDPMARGGPSGIDDALPFPNHSGNRSDRGRGRLGGG